VQVRFGESHFSGGSELTCGVRVFLAPQYDPVLAAKHSFLVGRYNGWWVALCLVMYSLKLELSNSLELSFSDLPAYLFPSFSFLFVLISSSVVRRRISGSSPNSVFHPGDFSHQQSSRTLADCLQDDCS